MIRPDKDWTNLKCDLIYNYRYRTVVQVILVCSVSTITMFSSIKYPQPNYLALHPENLTSMREITQFWLCVCVTHVGTCKEDKCGFRVGRWRLGRVKNCVNTRFSPVSEAPGDNWQQASANASKAQIFMMAGAEQGGKYCDAHHDENWMFGFLEAETPAEWFCPSAEIKFWCRSWLTAIFSITPYEFGLPKQCWFLFFYFFIYHLFELIERHLCK